MHKSTILGFAVAAFLAAAGTAHADVRLTMHDGLVTIVAKDATVRQILAEWARVGQATIVNADRIAGGPVSFEFTDVPEKQALDIILRSINGYFVAPRPTVVPNAARFDRIVVLPAAAQPRVLTASAPPPPLPQPNRFQLPPAPDADDPITSAVNDPSLRVPVVNQFNPPYPPPPGAPDSGRAAPATFAAPTAPVGTSAPGMVLQPPPPQPGQPQMPGAPPPVSGVPPARF